MWDHGKTLDLSVLDWASWALEIDNPGEIAGITAVSSRDHAAHWQQPELGSRQSISML